MRDASDRIWTVRSVVPDDLDGHRRSEGQFQAVFMRACLRNEGGFHVWKLDGAVTQRTFDSEREAVSNAKRWKTVRGVEYVADVRAFDLAPRLSDLVPEPAHRSMVRLGQGWSFVVLVKETTTSRGSRFTLALAEHNGPKPTAANLTQAGWRHLEVKLVQRLGRLGSRQYEELTEMIGHYGIPILFMDYIPRAVGKRVPPKHLPAR